MREIKFRGKRTDTGEWVYGDLQHVQRINTKEEAEQSGRRSEPAVRVANYDVEKVTIGQFTGLYDKNGRGVFEGDLLRGFDHVVSVGWLDGGFCGIKSDLIEPLMYLDVEDRKVIGNIHDNPDLLTE